MSADIVPLPDWSPGALTVRRVLSVCDHDAGCSQRPRKAGCDLISGRDAS